MTKLALPLSIVVLGIVVAVLHGYALNNFLYWHFPWLDIVMHFLGGLLASLFGLWFAERCNLITNARPKAILLFDVILFVFIISLLWESFEFMFKLVLHDPVEYIIDTIIDFLMGIMGAVFGFYLIYISGLFKKSSSHE